LQVFSDAGAVDESYDGAVVTEGGEVQDMTKQPRRGMQARAMQAEATQVRVKATQVG
jgi:hypothetical protein